MIALSKITKELRPEEGQAHHRERGSSMSIMDRNEQEVEIDRPRMQARKALASMSISQRRAFLITVMKTVGVPMREIAATLRCSESTAQRDAKTPVPDFRTVLGND
jgi:DNA-directed RNA polymerase specialized sigma24 family protein